VPELRLDSPLGGTTAVERLEVDAGWNAETFDSNILSRGRFRSLIVTRRYPPVVSSSLESFLECCMHVLATRGECQCRRKPK